MIHDKPLKVNSNRAKNKYTRVSRDHPCPICHKPDWCAVSADGQLARCQRVEQGAFKTGTDKNGETYYLHRLGDGPRPAVEVSCPPSGIEAKRADADALHRVYDALLAALMLKQSHRDALRKRGLSDGEIDRRLYRSLPIQGRAKLARELGERFGAEVLLSVPGFILKDKDGRKYITIAGSAGLLIPCRDLSGRTVALKARRDDAGEGPRYSYLSSAKYGGPGPGSPVHVPLGVMAPCPCVRLTEGELKADVAYLKSGLATISAPGVGAWRTALDVAKDLGATTIRLAFDMDAAENAAVARHLTACVAGLVALGLAVEVERWPGTHKGIDDALAAGAAVEVLSGDAARAYIAEVLTTATAGEPPPPPDPLDRLEAVLSEGGADGLFRDPELLKALAALAESDTAEFNCRRARMRNGGIRLRELDNALSPLRKAWRAERPPLISAGEYKVSVGRIVHLRPTKDGPVEAPLCNFSARIVAQTTVDDGAERSMRLAVEGQLHDGTQLSRVEIPAEDFARMEWVVPSWGTRAVVNAGRATADHLRCALQLLSGDVPQRVVYGHLGWRKVDGRWLYLHAGGALGEVGPVDGVEVVPPDALTRYVLPAPPAGDDLRRAMRSSLELLGFGPPRIAFSLLSAVYRAVLGGTDFAVHLVGQSGVFKSEIAALMQQHHGAGMDRPHLPGSWGSTGNSLEGVAFAAKDTLLTVDDFAPHGGAADVARLHREAERLLRAQGNAAGRQRMRRDGSLMPARPPRGLILSTGEDVPRGQSLRARMLAIEVERGALDADTLTARQRDAAEGLYAEAMAGFIQWLAPQYEGVRGRLAADRAELRDRAAGEGQHARTPGIVADLAIGLRYLLDFAAESGAIDAGERSQLWDRGWAAICEAGAAQAEHVEAAEPTGQFFRLLSAALASGRAHLAAPDGGHPDTPSAWGWRREDGRQGPDWRPQGKRVGWIDGDAVLLEPEASYATAQSLAVEQGQSLTVSARTLSKRMHERGLLAVDERGGKTHLTVRRTVEGRRREVIFLSVVCLPLNESVPSGPIAGPPAENGALAGALTHGKTLSAPASAPPNIPRNKGVYDKMGHLGHSEIGRSAPTGENISGAGLLGGLGLCTSQEKRQGGDALWRASPPLTPCTESARNGVEMG
ncbi:MAG TPA: DUF3854 domain-containing protein [Gemmataceae bacterium]|jgi:hypothetical protein